MSDKTYDEKSYELAEHFLADVPHGPRAAHLLAQDIQDTVETFLADDWARKQ